MRDGRKISGYLEGYEIGDAGPPALYLSPPIAVEVTVRGLPLVNTFYENGLTIPGSEVVTVWTPSE